MLICIYIKNNAIKAFINKNEDKLKEGIYVNKIRWSIVIAFCLTILTGCDQGNSITAVGSSAMQPLVEAAGELYSADHPGEFINVQGGGSGTGLSQVQSGAVNIGNSDLFAEEKSGVDANELIDHKIAVVGIAPIVNKGVGIDDISSKDVIRIFTGQVTNWKDLGGNDQEIVVINRAAGSGSRHTFEQWGLNHAESIPAQEQDSTGMVKQIVSTTPGAISYVSFYYLSDDIQPLSIDHIQPTDENVMNNQWKIWSYEHMYTKGEPEGLTKDFIDFVLSDEVQESIVPQLGYIPINKMQVERDAEGNTIELE